MVNYVHGVEVEAAWNKFLSSSEVEDILEWITSHGVDVDNEIQRFLTVPDSVTVTPSRLRMKRSSQNYSIQAFGNEVKEQVLIGKLNRLTSELIENGNDLAHLNLILHLKRPALEKLFREPEFLLVTRKLKNFGVDIDYLKLIAYGVLRWN